MKIKSTNLKQIRGLIAKDLPKVKAGDAFPYVEDKVSQPLKSKLDSANICFPSND